MALLSEGVHGDGASSLLSLAAAVGMAMGMCRCSGAKMARGSAPNGN